MDFLVQAFIFLIVPLPPRLHSDLALRADMFRNPSFLVECLVPFFFTNTFYLVYSFSDTFIFIFPNFICTDFNSNWIQSSAFLRVSFFNIIKTCSTENVVLKASYSDNTNFYPPTQSIYYTSQQLCTTQGNTKHPDLGCYISTC